MREFAADVALATGRGVGFAKISQEDLLTAELGLVSVLEHGLEFGDETFLALFKDCGR